MKLGVRAAGRACQCPGARFFGRVVRVARGVICYSFAIATSMQVVTDLCRRECMSCYIHIGRACRCHCHCWYA